MNSENTITALLLCLTCLIATCLISLSDNKPVPVHTSVALWHNEIIDITGVKNKKINDTIASLKVDIKPGINDYNITIENKGTMQSYIDSYIINSSINDENIIYNVNINVGDKIVPEDTRTYKLTIDNKKNKTYKKVDIRLIINLVNKKPSNASEYSLNNIKYNNSEITKINNKYVYNEDNPNNYLVFGNKCYRIIEIDEDNLLSIYNSEYMGICTNYKQKIETNYNNIKNIMEEVSSSGIINNYYEFTNEELLKLDDFNVNNTTSKITLQKNKYTNTIDWTLEETANEALATDNNYYNKDELLNITPIIKIKDVKTISGIGTKIKPYIIKEYNER